MRKIREKISIFIAKSPEKAILVGIMVFNVIFILLSAGIIAILSNHISGLKECSFWEAVYHTILMVLDAGCVESVIADVGKAGVFAAIVCIGVVVIGMMFFTGAVIGYITNGISNFIDSKNNGKNKLYLSDHMVIINWNPRAAEIINELLYKNRAATVVVFVPDNRKEIDEEIRNRLDTTLLKETESVYAAAKDMPFFARKKYLRENLLKDKITVIVREGDVAAATDLDDICISKARTVIILNNDDAINLPEEERAKGNTQTIKTLIQVSEISKANSKQTILVEVADKWTEELVFKIIEFKEEGKETIIPVSFNRLLGKTLSRIAVMPELYDVYDNLFSNKGAHFVSKKLSGESGREQETVFLQKALSENCHSIPLTVMDTMKGKRAFFMADKPSDPEAVDGQSVVTSKAKLGTDASFGERCIVVFGHNSNMGPMMEGFEQLRNEMTKKSGSERLSIVMIDDEESLRSHGCYKEYPYVRTLAANIFDNESFRMLETTVDLAEETTILVLSDDQLSREETDAYVLTYLIYIQEQIRKRKAADPEFERNKLDVIVEILNPKNENVVKSYGADKVIISNRYLSRVISQVSRGLAVVEFYANILSYVIEDRPGSGKEIFIRTAGELFEELPERCTAAELIRMVFNAGKEENKLLLLGYVPDKKDCIFFGGDQKAIEVELKPDDRLVVFGRR